MIILPRRRAELLRANTVANIVKVIWAVVYNLIGAYCMLHSLLPKTTPNGHNGFGFGVIHGFYVVVDMLLPIFLGNLAIVQNPIGFGYVVGFVLGLALLIGSIPRISDRQ